MNNQTILDAFNFRHATKAYDVTKKIAREDLTTILEAGRLSPSSFGLELWQFAVIESEELRQKLAPIANNQPQINQASQIVLIIYKRGDEIKPFSQTIQNQFKNVQKLPNEIFDMLTNFNAYFVSDLFKLDTERKLADWSARQTFLPLANMMTTAALLSIDSTPMEGFNQAQMDEFLKNELHLDPKDYGVSAILALGYRANEPRPKTRRNFEDVVKFY